MPETIEAKMTIRLHDVPWQQALEVALESQGLWYRYRANGRLLRVAPRKELDTEAEAAIVRQQNTGR